MNAESWALLRALEEVKRLENELEELQVENTRLRSELAVELSNKVGWMPVTPESPGLNIPVLVIEKDMGIMTARRIGVDFFKGYNIKGEGGMLCEAERWMPLPQEKVSKV